MGQYYKAVLLADDGEIVGELNPFDYDSGAKIFEHAWLGNPYVAAVEQLLLDAPTRVAWAGDYAGLRTGEDVGLLARAKKAPLYLVTEQAAAPDSVLATGRYVINHDQRAYVDKDAVTPGAGGLRLHPLPMLTVEGFRRRNRSEFRWLDGEVALIGTWARDHITVADTTPARYQELRFDLIER